eukprot:6182420-Pleurochrysis_carterae.AAC.10
MARDLVSSTRPCKIPACRMASAWKATENESSVILSCFVAPLSVETSQGSLAGQQLNLGQMQVPLYWTFAMHAEFCGGNRMRRTI